MNIGTLMAHVGLDTTQLKRGSREATNELGRFSKQSSRGVGNLSGMVTKLGGVLAGIGAGVGITMLGRSIITTGMQFQQTMEIVGGVTKATAAEFTALNDIAREMGETTEWTATNSANALQFMGMAGFSAAKSIEALPDVLDLATAGQIDLGRAADIATNALTAMGLPVKQLGRINDVFIGTITRSNTNMEMMAESFKYAAPLANAYGYSVEKLSGMIGILGNAGIQGCYDDQTDVLTPRGWIPWADVQEGDKLATRNPGTGAIEYQKPTRLIRYHHKGPMYVVQNQSVDLCVTPDHRMWVKRRGHDDFEVLRANQIDGQPVAYEIATFALGDDEQLYPRLSCGEISAGGAWAEYDGEVFCAEVPNHLLIVRRNGKAIVSGNSMAGTQLAMAIQKGSEAADKMGLEGGDLIDVLKKMKDENWSNAQVMDVFGQRAGRAALVLKENTAAARELQGELQGVGGEAGELAERMRSTVSGSFKELKSVIESLGLDIFENFKDDIQNLFRSLSSLIRENKRTIVGLITAIGKTISGIIKIISPFVGMITGIIAVVQSMFGQTDKVATESLTAMSGVVGTMRAVAAEADAIATSVQSSITAIENAPEFIRRMAERIGVWKPPKHRPLAGIEGVPEELAYAGYGLGRGYGPEIPPAPITVPPSPAALDSGMSEYWAAQERAAWTHQDAINAMGRSRGEYGLPGLVPPVDKAFDAPMQKATTSWDKFMSGLESRTVAFGQNFAGAIADALTGGEDSFKRFFDYLKREFIQLAAMEWIVKPLFSFMNLDVGVGHSGGMVGSLGTRRTVPALAFAGAQHYGMGGMVGGNEVPIIAHRGEMILTPAQQRGLGGREVNVHYHGMPGAEILATEGIGGDGGPSLEVQVWDAMEAGIAQGKFDRSMARRFGTRAQGARR